MARSTPRRRCVGKVPTTVTPAVWTMAPGTVSSNGNAPAPPTMRPFSLAACMRSIGRLREKRSMRSSVGSSAKYCPIANTACENSSRSAHGLTRKLIYILSRGA